MRKSQTSLLNICKCILVYSCLGFSFSSYASDLSPTSSPQTLNETMTEIGKVAVDLFPLIVSKHSLSDREKNLMKQDLARLTELFHQAQPFFKTKSDTYEISYELVLDQLEETKRVLQMKKFDYARSRLYALGSICTSCHTQDTKLRTLFSGTTREHFPDDFAYAEFNFITRNYKQAELYYDKYLTTATTHRKTELEIVTPLQRLITIYAQILNKPAEGAKKLAQYTALKDHTVMTKKHLRGWISGLKTLDAHGASHVRDVDFKTLNNYVRQYLGPLDQQPSPIYSTPQEEVQRVWLRGLLYHYLNGNPSKTEVPKILYWLAISDRAIGYNFYYSLADLYLKECILHYSDDPYAKRCYNEYKEYTMFSYSGSAGTFIPPEVQQELENLKKAIK